MESNDEWPIVSASFILFGFSEDPQDITTVLGISPDREGRVGQEIVLASGVSTTVKDNYWEIKASAGISSLMLEDYLLDILRRIESVADRMESLPEGARRKVLIQVSLPKNGQTPGVYLGEDVIDRMARLRLSLDLDLG